MLAASFRSLGPILTVGLLASTPALADDLLPESTDLAAPAPDLAAAFAPQQTRLRRALLGDQMKGASLPKGARLQDDAPVPEGTPGGGLAVQPGETGRNFDMELGFRGRYMTVPDSILDIWFYDDDTPGYAYSESRPQVHGYSVGIEFVVKSKVEEESSGGSNGIFYVQYIDNLMPDGYWDDREEPANHLDGDWLAPTDNFGVIALGANYAYEVHMVKTMNTNGNFGMSMVVGGGLGLGVVIGDIEYWRPDAGTPSFERKDNRDLLEGTKPIPPVVPLVDINIGFRFNFGDRFVMRLEGGLQDMLYLGGSVGLMF